MGIWDTIAIAPITNMLVWLSGHLWDSLGLAIIALTIIVNLALYPLTIRQIKTTKAMQSMQPKLKELQAKYAKDKQKLAQEQMKLYKEQGMSPTGCLLPMLVQMPVWIALFYSIRNLIGDTPEAFVRLAELLYSNPALHTSIPLTSDFLWFNLALPDSFFVLPILVGASMWVSQKMSMTQSADPRMAQQNRMMLWMMPLMFTFISLQFPSGLAIFWFTSTMIRVVLQYTQTGWGGLLPNLARTQAAAKEGEPAAKRKAGGKVIDATVTDSRPASEGGILNVIGNQLKKLSGRGEDPKDGL